LTGIPLIEPDASHLIGLVASDRDPLAPVAHALLDLARRLGIGNAIDCQVGRLSTIADHTSQVDRERRLTDP
jgi:hypothetical protein